MNNYEKRAIEFAKKHKVTLKVLGEDFRPYFPEDKQSRSVFKLKLTRNRKNYTFEFGQSIAKTGEEPTMYDVLACLTKYNPGYFEDFCYEFGYDEDSRAAERVYKACYKEYKAVERLFGDIINELLEIE